MSVQSRLLLPIVLLAALIASPAAASAGTTISLSGNVLAVQGDDGDNVIFETSYDPNTPWFTTPAPGTLTAGSGCTQLAPNNVECAGVTSLTTAQIDLRGGDDLFLWSATNVAMTLNGGSGDDELSGGQGADVINGGSGDDIIVGLGGNDLINGGDGNDVIDGSSGDDRIDGGAGIDKLNGDGDGDADTAAKPFGDDTVISRDASADQVDCEGGNDISVADFKDAVSPNCESVSYTESSSSGKGSGTSSGSQTSVTNANTALTLTIKRRRLPTLKAFAKGTPIKAQILVSASCIPKVTMTVSKGEAKRLRYRGSRTLAKAGGTTILPSEDPLFSIRANSKFRKKFKRISSKSRASLSINVSCKPSDGKAVTAKLAIRLKR